MHEQFRVYTKSECIYSNVTNCRTEDNVSLYLCVWTQPEPKLLLRFHGLNNLELTSLRCLHRILINWSNVVLSNVVSKKKKYPCLFIWYSFPNVLNYRRMTIIQSHHSFVLFLTETRIIPRNCNMECICVILTVAFVASLVFLALSKRNYQITDSKSLEGRTIIVTGAEQGI